MSVTVLQRALAVAAIALALTLAAPAATSPPPPRFADAHLHYVDYFQESDGMDALLAAMDEAGVDHAMVSGMPVVKKWADSEPKRPEYVFGDDAAVYWFGLTDVIVARAVEQLPPEKRARLHPFLCGINPTDKNAADHVRRMLEWYPRFWQGIGEIITRHDDLTGLMQDEGPRVNHPALDGVYALAAEHDLPVLVHSNVTSEREDEPIYLRELEEVLAKHPRTKIIWAHAGTSPELDRRLDMDFLASEVGRLLDMHANLWIDLSWDVVDGHVLDEHDRVDRKWLRVIQAHPDRFMLGSDALGRFGSLAKRLDAYGDLLDALSEDDARKLARDNFLAVLPRPPGAP